MQLRLNYAYVNDGLELLVVGEVRIIQNILHSIPGVEKAESAILIFVIFRAALNHIRSF